MLSASGQKHNFSSLLSFLWLICALSNGDIMFQLSEDLEQKPAGESRKLVTDEVPHMVSNHVEDQGSASVPYSDVSSQRQTTPKRSMAHSNSVSGSNMVEGNPHSVVHVEDTMSAFSRTESFPVSGMLSGLPHSLRKKSEKKLCRGHICLSVT